MAIVGVLIIVGIWVVTFLILRGIVESARRAKP